jgi:dienelactone hydrolase
MKKAIYILILLLTAIGAVSAQTFGGNQKGDVVKIDARPDEGFSYPFYLYIPQTLRDAKEQNVTHTILVIPNNTGTNDDDLSVHEADVKKRITQNGMMGAQLGVAILMPVFPRPATDWKIYTHALDRDTMLTDKKEYRRLDLQLVSMIDYARERLAKDDLKFDKRVFITGFSASAMFANRFTFLHPKLIKAVAVGSPGGWAITPASEYKEKTLRYPIGTGDFKIVSGEKFDLKNLRKVPMFLYLGDKDENDSVTFGDGYEEEDKNLIFELFGKTPVERWEISKKLYAENRLNAEFKLYPNVKHTVTKEIVGDIMAFFSKYK